MYGDNYTSNSNGYKPIGTTNYNPLIWKGNSTGKPYIDGSLASAAQFGSSVSFGNGASFANSVSFANNVSFANDINFDNNLITNLPAVGNTGQLPIKTFSQLRISKFNLGMNVGGANKTLVLIDVFASNSCGTLTLYVYSSIGTFCSVYAIGTDAITRISTESNTGIVYSLAKSGGQLVYTQIHAQTNVDTFVSGMFVGIQ
jgi:hypothetical protein